MNATQFKINQLRMTNIQKLLEGLVVLLGAIFVTALLPQLLFKYLYADAALTETPLLLEYLSDVIFGIGAAYLLYIIAGAISRGKQIVQLERQLLMGEDTSVMQDEKELKELEALVDEALATQTETTAVKSTKRKKSSRKASKK